MTDIVTTQTLTAPAASPTWDHQTARAERLDARYAAIDEHRRELARRDGPRWSLGLNIMALGGGF
jgi:hypothetical protein